MSRQCGLLYEAIPASQGGDPVNYIGQLTFDDKVLDLMNKGYKFLHQIKVIESPDMPKTAINDAPLKKAMREMGVTAPLGEIRGLPRSAFKN